MADTPPFKIDAATWQQFETAARADPNGLMVIYNAINEVNENVGEWMQSSSGPKVAQYSTCEGGRYPCGTYWTCVKISTTGPTGG